MSAKIEAPTIGVSRAARTGGGGGSGVASGNNYEMF